MDKSLAASLRQTLFNSWWVIAFALFCLIGYEQGIKERDQQYISLTNQLSALNNEIHMAQLKQIRLAGEVSGQNDPHWIELVLMRELGLTPEGQIKVIWISP